jgi:hypothetical protein
MSGRSVCSEVTKILTLIPDVAPNTHPAALLNPRTSPPRGLPNLGAFLEAHLSILVVSPRWSWWPPPSVGGPEGRAGPSTQPGSISRPSTLTSPFKPCWFPLGHRPSWAAYLPGPVPAGSGHLASAVPSPERWQPDCAEFPSTSPTAPSSRTPSGTRPRQRQG